MALGMLTRFYSHGSVCFAKGPFQAKEALDEPPRILNQSVMKPRQYHLPWPRPARLADSVPINYAKKTDIGMKLESSKSKKSEKLNLPNSRSG